MHAHQLVVGETDLVAKADHELALSAESEHSFVAEERLGEESVDESFAEAVAPFDEPEIFHAEARFVVASWVVVVAHSAMKAAVAAIGDAPQMICIDTNKLTATINDIAAKVDGHVAPAFPVHDSIVCHI
ncbi:hypothetical protein COLO4_07945 [Corchorus olitorius]|uniref:Uncharacterized protein n=1 Tax=Corchorus olitorius TaxID=93759 RepID=A0A1R3KI43_9ROSI|nr:hypothetical protein COLO4_07945 [Corchorus olitorius]